MPTDGPVLALCESRRQADWLRRHRAAVGQPIEIVATTPDAAWSLEKSGIPFDRLEDYDRRRSADEVERLLAGQIQWARWVDARIQDHVPLCRRLDFRPARSYLLYVKDAWDTYLHRASLLESLSKARSPGHVLFFSNPQAIAFGNQMAVRGSILADSVPLWAGRYGIVPHPIHDVGNRDVWEYQYTHLGLGIRLQLSQLRQAVARRYRSVLRAVTSPARDVGPAHTGASGPTLIVNRRYDITDEVVWRLQERGVAALELEDLMEDLRTERPDGEVLNELARVWDLIVDEDAFWQPGGWQDWSLRPVLMPLFRHFWFVAMPALLRHMSNGLDLIERRRPAAVALAIVPGPETVGLIMAARSSGVPTIIYLHGASVGDLEIPTIDATDGYWGQIILTHGEGQSHFIQSRPKYDDAKATPIAVGSARVDRLQRNGDDRRVKAARSRLAGVSASPVILYVPGVFFSNYYRFESNDFRNIRSFDIRRKIAALFKSRPDVRFVYKSFLSQGHDPTLDMLRQTCPSCVVIADTPLSVLQWAVDGVIHEIPSSAMIEGLATDKPMVVFADRDVYRMSEEAKVLLRRRVNLAESGTEFVNGASALLDQARVIPLADPDQDFLRKYVTHTNDGASARRAADTIYTLAVGRAEKLS